MDHLHIPMEENDASWKRRCKERINKMKAEQFYRTDLPSQSRLLEDLELWGEKKFMTLELYEAVQNGNVDNFIDVLEQVFAERKLPLSDILDQVTHAGDSLLHEAAYFGRENIAELIVDNFPELLTKRNIKGDTARHVAARKENSNVIKVILSRLDADISDPSSGDEQLTRLTNEYGNTALHEAVYSNYLEGVKYLYDADKHMAHYLNKSSESPLYLAVSSSNEAIVDYLLQAPLPYDKQLPKCRGNSPLHAAIEKRNSALLKEILKKRSEFMYFRDEDGGTPLHYAASCGFLEGVPIILNQSNLTALEWNNNGHLPIHLACKRGRVQIVKEFLQQKWPNARGLLNQKGQNILHVAAKSGHHHLVKYLLKNAKLDQLTLNEKDKNGNTPLHLASKQFYCKVIFYLTRDKRIDVELKNNEGYTAADFAWLHVEIPIPRREYLALEILRTVGGHPSIKGLKMIQLRSRLISPKQDWIKDFVNTLMLVAILIATVTFAAGFTVPGSLYSADDPNPQNRGMAVLDHRKLFHVFMIFNTVAMYSSTAGCIFLFWAQHRDYFVAARAFAFANAFMVLALVTMSVGFMAATRLVTSNVSWLANFITIIGIAFLSLILFTYILKTFPPFDRIPLLRQVYELLIRITMTLYGPEIKLNVKARERLFQQPENNKDK